MEDDLYGDLDEALNLPLDKDIEKKNHEDEQKLKADRELLDRLKKQDDEFEKLRKSYERLNVNASYLMETAKTEVARKDNKIKELQRQLDDLTFRRTKIHKKTKDVFTQTEVELSQVNDRNRGPSRDKARYKSGSMEKIYRSSQNTERDRRTEQKYSRDRPSDKFDDRKGESRSKDWKSSRKRSRSRSKHSEIKPTEKRRREEEKLPEKSRHRERKSEVDLREMLLKKSTEPRSSGKAATGSKQPSPRKAKNGAIEKSSKILTLKEEPTRKASEPEKLKREIPVVKIEQTLKVEKPEEETSEPPHNNVKSLTDDFEDEIFSTSNMQVVCKQDKNDEPTKIIKIVEPFTELNNPQSSDNQLEMQEKSSQIKKDQVTKAIEVEGQLTVESSPKLDLHEPLKTETIKTEVEASEPTGSLLKQPNLNDSHDSSGASKENSINKQKRTSYTKEVVDDVVVFTFARSIHKKKKKHKEKL